MWLAFRNNDTGFTAIKQHLPDDVKQRGGIMRRMVAYHKRIGNFQFWETETFFRPRVDRGLSNGQNNPVQSV